MTVYINKVFFIFLLLFYSFFLFAQKEDIKNTNILKEIVYTLASDSMLGRAAGSEGEERAENYLVSYYKKIGLVALNDSYIKKFKFPKDSTHTASAMNVIGMLDNKAPSTIVIGAHYDHIGMGGPKSRSLTSNKIHNGADDNASGVAMMLMLAEHLKKSKIKNQKSDKFNYLFIAFSAHEDGLYGSQAFVDEKIYDLSKVKLFLNLDMVGRLDTINPMLKVMRNDHEKYLDSILYKLTKDEFNLIITEDKTQTDASAFINNNIPSVSFTTGIHDDYHKISDDSEKINYYGMNEITKYIRRVIASFESYKLKIIPATRNIIERPEPYAKMPEVKIDENANPNIDKKILENEMKINN
ncbi:MAG: hypothetical protein A2X08_03700 [Bacteroidetes bacterium GWA2_32_17]|nr:MAG: hypothetical protein A2X08_03700 [Bacteroidetes bacterium GWA2_32_17]